MGPSRGTEFYLNVGAGFHSNDARAVVTGDGAATAPTTPLVRATGNGVGVGRAWRLVNLEGGYHISKRARVVLDVFNVLNAHHSDIDYFYTSRLTGEAAGVDDIHLHPVLPRTARVGLVIGF